MEPRNLKLCLPDARNPARMPCRRTGDECAALETIRDYCTDYVKGHNGPMSDFKPAYINVVIEHLNDARLLERRLYTGITGKDAG